MTWCEISQTMEKARDSLPAMSGDEMYAKEQFWALQWEQMAPWLNHFQPAVEASVRVYARQGSWPQLSEDELLILHWRAEQAVDATFVLASVELAHGLSVSTLGEEDLVEWFFCVWWALGGEAQIVDRIEALAHFPGVDSDDPDTLV
jgi:hypothetical protein